MFLTNSIDQILFYSSDKNVLFPLYCSNFIFPLCEVLPASFSLIFFFPLSLYFHATDFQYLCGGTFSLEQADINLCLMT